MADGKITVGFAGLGIMGTPMATHLIDAGYHLFVYTLGKLPEHLIEKHVTICLSSQGVAERADIIITMVPDTPDVEKVLFGANGVAEGLSKGKTVVDMSSISPIATKAFAAKIQAKSCEYLDAPVSGGQVGAINATLSIMVGGKPEVFEQIKPLFACMGQNITWVGQVGDGQTAKVANQIIVALNIEAVSEALLFAAKAGADPARVRQALMGGFASSRILEGHAERMINGTFNPGFRIRLHQKDLNLALDNATWSFAPVNSYFVDPPRVNDTRNQSVTFTLHSRRASYGTFWRFYSTPKVVIVVTDS